MNDFLENTDTRFVAMILIGIVLLVSATEVTYLLWPQIKNYTSLHASHKVLERALGDSNSLDKQLERSNAEVAELSHRLHGDMAKLPEKEMESFVIGRLQTVSWATDVELISVKPGRGKQVQNFRESIFDVKLIARYHDFFEWLQIINHELGYIVIKKFEISADNNNDEMDNPKLGFLITLVSYRIEQDVAQ